MEEDVVFLVMDAETGEITEATMNKTDYDNMVNAEEEAQKEADRRQRQALNEENELMWLAIEMEEHERMMYREKRLKFEAEENEFWGRMESDQ